MHFFRGAVLAFVCSAAACAQSAVTDARYAHLARGVNLTRWFQYGSRIPITATDRDLLKDAGFTSVRIPVAPQYLLYRWSTPDRVERNLANLDKAIDLFLSAGMAVTLDFHADVEYLDYHLSTPGAADSLVVLWRELATRYANRDPELLFFEIMNEPDGRFTEAAWDAEQKQALAAIHSIAPRHTVILDAVKWSGLDGLLQLKPYPDPNVIYALHYYSPSTFTHQGADWTGKQGIAELRNVPWPAFVPELQPVIDAAPSAPAQALLRQYQQEDWDASRIDWDIQLAAAWARTWGVRVVVNEFGDFKPFAPPESRARWLHDVRLAIERQQLAWAVWDYAAGFDLTVLEQGKRSLDPLVSAALGLRPYTAADPVRGKAALFSGSRTAQIGAASDTTGFAEGILATDVNGDGYPDLLVTPMTWPDLTEHTVQAWLNNGSGVFHPLAFDGPAPTVRAASSIIAGHFDSSGRPGFFFPEGKLILPSGRDSLRDATASFPEASGAAAGDVDNDGVDDLVVFGHGTQLLRNNGEGQFMPDPEAFPSWAVDPQQENNRFTCGVFVPRGNANIRDLLVFGKTGSPARVFRNDGQGHFRNSILLPPAGPNTGPASGGCATVADLNGDGFPDVIAGFQPAVIQVLISNGDGTFRDESALRIAALPAARGALRRVALAGNALVLTRVGEPPVVEINRGGRFEKADWNPGPTPWVVAPGDFNHDGLVDLVFAGGGEAPLTIRFGE
jgi:endoglucanase